jgi:glycosyltransferase involved in cell wall biosynthesis
VATGEIGTVLHLSPTYFADSSVVGGGERYAVYLARAMSRLTATRFVAFGPARQTLDLGGLRAEVYPARRLVRGCAHDPLAWGFLRELRRADVVHCHQSGSAVCGIAAVAGRFMGKPVFATDLGGGESPFLKGICYRGLYSGFLEISGFAARGLPVASPRQVIFGGVDRRFLDMPAVPRKRQVCFVGRLLPHKGINYLIEAMEPDVALEIIGRPYRDDYYALLKGQAVGKNVRFVTDGTDDDITAAYASSAVSVLPSVCDDVYGSHHDAPELLGLVLLEAMACGTPVICTRVGGMPEIVEEGVTGFVVAPNSAAALRDRIQWVLAHPEEARRMGEAGRRCVRERFTWDAVARRCLDAYAVL